MFWRINRKCKKMTDDGLSENLSAQVSCKRFLTCLIFKTCTGSTSETWNIHVDIDMILNFKFRYSRIVQKGEVCASFLISQWDVAWFVFEDDRGISSFFAITEVILVTFLSILLDTRIQGETVLGYKNLSNI